MRGSLILPITALVVLCTLAYAEPVPDGIPPGGNDVLAGGASDSTTQRPTVAVRQALIFDSKLSMRSGSESLIGIHHGIAWAEDRLIGTRWFNERGPLGKFGGMACRLSKYVLLDTPVDYFTVVYAHEYWGHGARYRELDIHQVDYGYDWPPPFGAGGGYASAGVDKSHVSDDEEMAIWLGGLEVQSLLNRRLALGWISQREIHYREASLYFWSWQIALNYIQSSSDELTGNEPDNDPQAYVRILNRKAGYEDANHLRFTVNDLQRRTLINVANPFIVFALYTQLKTYLFDGHSSTKPPMLRFCGVEYLPRLRAGLTPFGPEYHLENYLRTANRAALVDLRFGDQTFHRDWGGIGFEVRNLFHRDGISVDFNLDAWNQPGIELGGPGHRSKGEFGVASSARGNIRLVTSGHPIFALLEIGYKSAGFLEGYEMDAAPIAMLGIGIQD